MSENGFRTECKLNLRSRDPMTSHRKMHFSRKAFVFAFIYGLFGHFDTGTD